MPEQICVSRTHERENYFPLCIQNGMKAAGMYIYNNSHGRHASQKEEEMAEQQNGMEGKMIEATIARSPAIGRARELAHKLRQCRDS